MKLKNKIALVTGSTKSIGLAIARLFAQQGAIVIMTGRNSEEGLKVAQSIGAHYLTLDVSSERDWQPYKNIDIG